MRHLKHDFLTIKKNSSKSIVSSKLVSQSMLLFFCASYVLPFLIITFLFGVCKRTIANYINLTREDLHKNLVPKFINYNDRSVLIAHNTSMAKTLFDIPDNKTCSIFDSTYRLVQKSKNYAGQKQLWSEQKKCHSSNLW